MQKKCKKQGGWVTVFIHRLRRLTQINYSFVGWISDSVIRQDHAVYWIYNEVYQQKAL